MTLPPLRSRVRARTVATGETVEGTYLGFNHDDRRWGVLDLGDGLAATIVLGGAEVLGPAPKTDTVTVPRPRLGRGPGDRIPADVDAEVLRGAARLIAVGQPVSGDTVRSAIASLLLAVAGQIPAPQIGDTVCGWSGDTFGTVTGTLTAAANDDGYAVIHVDGVAPYAVDPVTVELVARAGGETAASS